MPVIRMQTVQKIAWIMHPRSVRAHFRLINPNTIKSYKILQKLSPKHAAHGVAQSTYPNYRHGKAACLNSPPGVQRGTLAQHAAGPGFEPRAQRARSARFFSPPSLPSHLPQQPRKSVRDNYRHSDTDLAEDYLLRMREGLKLPIKDSF